jgi:hypothetical protein
MNPEYSGTSGGVEPGDLANQVAPGLEITIVMPCLNEAETLGACISQARAYLVSRRIEGEIVVGDNGSTDGSQAIAKQLGARVVNVPVRGYGAALYHASLAARGRFIIMGDSDGSYDFSGLDGFVEKLREGNDLVMGNRFLGGIAHGAMPWKNRYIGNPALSGVGRVLFKCQATDLHCGLRGYSRTAFARMDLRTTGMEFASEMVIKATLLGMRVAEVPTTLSPDGRSRPPHLKPWRDGWRHLRFMLLYSPDWLFLYPGLGLLLTGLLTGAWLLRGPQRVGSVVLDVHTLLYAALAVILGVQSIFFAALARTFATAEGLLPANGWHRRLRKFVNLEVGITAGLLLAAIGLAGSIHAVLGWRRQGFGALDVGTTLREVIPSVVAIVVGAQVALSSFFLGVLGLSVRHLDGAPDRRGDPT